MPRSYLEDVWRYNTVEVSHRKFVVEEELQVGL
jgi:hypothetical protein